MIAAGCERLDTPFCRGQSNGRSGRDSGLEQKDSTSGSASAPDTVCWAAVVKVPDGYDWMRDTLAGRFSGELLFYRGGQPCLSIPLNGSLPVSPDPGTHHIIRGHLYTECCSGGLLHILRDGVPLLHLPGDGFLKGLLQVADGSLWTLVCTPADGGLTLRRNGETVVRIARGSAVGGLGEGHSALYEDDGHVVGILFVDFFGHPIDGSINLFFRNILDKPAVADGNYFVHFSGFWFRFLRRAKLQFFAQNMQDF